MTTDERINKAYANRDPLRGYTVKEIAEMVGTDYNTIRAIQRHAFEKLARRPGVRELLA